MKTLSRQINKQKGCENN